MKKRSLNMFTLLLIYVMVFADISAGNLAFYPDTLQKGVCYTTWQREKYASQSTRYILSDLRDMGVDHIQFIVTWYQDRYDSTKIFATDLTPSDTSLAKAMKVARDIGHHVMLKPQIDLLRTDNGAYWRGSIEFNNEEDKDKWFKEYKKFILKYAKIAQRENVDLFCMGSEFVALSGETERWKDIIKAVRKVYKGGLTYSAHWDNYPYIGFWDDLDFIGIAAYFPLSEKNDPSYDDLLSGWQRWKAEIAEFYEYKKKPLLFTEIGYSCSVFAAKEPWKKGKGRPDFEVQEACYEAFFEAVWGEPWLAGAYWWRTGPRGEKHGVPNFCMIGRPSGKVLKHNYCLI